MNTLYIFATSERPDVYINSLAYSIEHLNVKAIFVIVISEHDYKDEIESSKLLASTVVGNISAQLRELSMGKYIDFSAKPGNRVPVELTRASNGCYEHCLMTMNQSGTTSIVIPLSDLDQSLRTYAGRGHCIIDVSALKKNLLVDVVATLLSIGSSEVYSFELKKKPTFGQDDLWHNLRLHDDFVFRNVADSEPVRKSLRRIKQWSARSRALLVFTAVLASIFIPISLLNKNSQALATLNVAAMAASIGAYLFLWVRDWRT